MLWIGWTISVGIPSLLVSWCCLYQDNDWEAMFSIVNFPWLSLCSWPGFHSNFLVVARIKVKYCGCNKFKLFWFLSLVWVDQIQSFPLYFMAMNTRLSCFYLIMVFILFNGGWAVLDILCNWFIHWLIKKKSKIISECI